MAFEAWAIVEIMGHQIVGGKVSEETHFGSPLMRVDVPKSSKREGFTVYYGGNAIYKITPTTEEIVKAFVEKQDPEPIKPYMLALPSLVDKVELSGEPHHIYGRMDEDGYPSDDDDNEDQDDYDDEDQDDPLSDDFADESDEGFGEAFPRDDDDEEEENDNPLHKLTDKERAARTAKRIVAEPFIVIDTETTSLDHHNGEVIQFAAINHLGEVLLNTYIRPENSITNSEYHGITDAMVLSAPKFPEIYPKIKELLDSAPVMVYNLAYDWKMLDGNAMQHDLDKFAFKTPACIMELYAQFHGEWNSYHGNYKWQKLNGAVIDLKLKFEGHEHDALADAKATLAVLKKLAEFAEEPAKDIPF